MTSVVSTTPSYLYWLIVGCEVGFWLFLGAALAVRYLLHRERLSKGLLLALPAIDLLLLSFTVADLRGGTLATFAHGLAAAYVGFTIAFGSIAIVWADQRFAHLFAGGPKPSGPSKQRCPAVRHELGLWLRCIVAAAVTMGILVAMIAIVDNDPVTDALREWFRIAMGAVIFWFFFGPVWTLLFFRRSVSE
jgi:hypothetical protein